MRAELRRGSKPGDTIYVLSNTDEALKQEPTLLEEAHKSRVKKGLKNKLIYSYKKGYVKSDTRLKREAVKLNQDIRANINLYPNKATFGTYDKDNPAGILIESSDIVGALRQLFELAWDAVKSKK